MKKWLVVAVMALLPVGATAEDNVSIPAGTALKVKLQTTLATFTSKSGDPFSGRVTEPVVVGGKTVIPIGATVQGRVTKVNEPRRMTGKPTLGIFPETVVLPNGERYMLKFDAPDAPELESGTHVVVNRLLWACGYHVAEDQIVFFSERDLVLAPGAPT